ncbi:SPOR domain-containing protein [bacterium]|nr:SPOR domain-containing protein [bacterium]
MSLNKNYSFTQTTFMLFLCVCALIALLMFILGYQVGRVHGVKPFAAADKSYPQQQPSHDMSAFNQDQTPIPFESDELSFYKSVHRATPIIPQTASTQITKTSKPTATPTIKPPLTPTPVPEVQLPTPQPGRYSIQVASFSERDAAKTLAQTLLNHDFPAYTEPVTTQGKTLYRVRVGHFNDRETAQKVSNQLKSKEKLDTWVASD